MEVNGRARASPASRRRVAFHQLIFFAALFGLGACSADPRPEEAPLLRVPVWRHLSSATGGLPAPGPSDQQTASLILDADKDGLNDFLIACRVKGPSVLWFRRAADGWEKYVIDKDFLRVEAGGASHDIDGDGDLDVVFGGDAGSNEIWWWENPYPNYAPETSWTRRRIKSSGETKHHDQAFGDFDGDGRVELAAWNQRGRTLLLFEIPSDPRQAAEWPSQVIYGWTDGPEHEGIAAADVNHDGKMDIVGGGRWFEHASGADFTAHLIDDGYRFSRTAAGQLKEGGWLEIVFVPGDADGRAKWFEWDGQSWIGHELLNTDVIHGHSLSLADINGDGHLDIFSAEMGQWGGGRNLTANPNAKMRIFYGDGQGRFTETIVTEGFGNHESKLADLDGDGDADILGKPYNWKTPRVDVWLNEPARRGPLSRWKRHVVDRNKPWRAVFITAGDLNGDGHKDIITGGWWYKNPGRQAETWTRNMIGLPLRNMAAVYDLDGDGDLDILGAEGEGSDANPRFVWARNDGVGGFSILDNVPSGDGDFLQGVAVGDFQKTGHPQVALSWHQAGRGIQMLSVPSKPSDERWAWAKISDLSLDEQLSAGDIDKDGDLDLLLGTQWLRNDGSSWSLHTLHDPPGIPDRNRLADISGDGRLDAVVGYEASRMKGKLAWYEQGAAPAQAWAEHLIAMIIGPMSLDVADMDGDGDHDVVAGQHNLIDPPSSRLLIFENEDGRGEQWVEHVLWTGDEHHDGSQAADIDGDGDLDIISIGWTHPRVVLYENLAEERDRSGTP